jgi:hypothetical protein
VHSGPPSTLKPPRILLGESGEEGVTNLSSAESVEIL